MELINVEIQGVPQATYMAVCGETTDRVFKYIMAYDRVKYTPIGDRIVKLKRRRKFFLFGPFQWVPIQPVALFSPEGSEVRRFFSYRLPAMQRELDEYLYNFFVNFAPKEA